MTNAGMTRWPSRDFDVIVGIWIAEKANRSLSGRKSSTGDFSALSQAHCAVAVTSQVKLVGCASTMAAR